MALILRLLSAAFRLLCARSRRTPCPARRLGGICWKFQTIKPLDRETLVRSASKTGRVLTVEEHNIYGGLGGAAAEALARHCPVKMDFGGDQDFLTESGPYDELMAKYGISTAAIIEKARGLLG
jgi:transketolase